MECMFCKIVNKEIPAKIILENDLVLAFENIKPVHPVHALIISKKHIPSVQELAGEDKEYAAAILLAAKEVARIKNVDKTGYRLIFNYGKDSGQTVEHLHMHLLGGEPLPFATG